MTNIEIGSIVLNLILGVAMYLLKESHQDTKRRIEKLEESTVKKDDFKEFKNELKERLDRFDAKLDQIIPLVPKPQ